MKYGQKDLETSSCSGALQKSSSQPDSPSTPSAFSSGIDQDYTLVDDSLKSFKLGEGMSSSSHSGIQTGPVSNNTVN